MQSSKAAEIPEELFEIILWYACGPYSIMWSRSNVAKAVASACGSVNRYWARLSRRMLFQSINLRSPDDIHGLCDILDNPTLPDLEPIADLVEMLFAYLDKGSTPWLHLFLLLVDPRLRKAHFLTVNALPSGGHTWRTLHPSLPRSLPGSLMPIEELDLEQIHFPSGRVLSRLLSSIPLLHRFHALKLTFDTAPTLEDFLTRPFTRKVHSVSSDDLQLCLSFVPLFVANITIQQRSLKTDGRGGRSLKGILDDDDLKLLQELVGIFGTAQHFEITFRSKGVL